MGFDLSDFIYTQFHLLSPSCTLLLLHIITFSNASAFFKYSEFSVPVTDSDIVIDGVY